MEIRNYYLVYTEQSSSVYYIVSTHSTVYTTWTSTSTAELPVELLCTWYILKTMSIGILSNSPWPSDAHLNNDSSDDEELGGGSMSIVFPTICHWCVLQGRGAREEDTQECADWMYTASGNQNCIGKLIANHTDWTVDQLREEIKFLVAHGADPAYTDSLTGRSALHECARCGSVVGIKALMTLSLKGLSANDMLDNQLDQQAIAHGYLRSDDADKDRATKLKNEQNIDLFALTNLGLTVVHLASMRGHSNVLNAIVEYLEDNPFEGPSPFTLFDAPDTLGFTPSMYATERGHLYALKVLHRVLCSTEENKDLSSFERTVARPHARILAHYAALHDRVNILQYLDEVGACHLHQDLECRYPIDLAKEFDRIGACVFLIGCCAHPYVDNNSHCGICKNFVLVDGGPIYSPIPGHRNLTLCDCIQDWCFMKRNQKKTNADTKQVGYKLWFEASDIGTTYPDDVRSDDIEIEELTLAAQEVLRHIGLEKEHLDIALNDCVETCQQFQQDNDDLDSVTAKRFHRLIGSLPCVQALSDGHRRCICRQRTIKHQEGNGTCTIVLGKV